MKKVLLAVALAQCVGCSSMHGASDSAGSMLVIGASVIAVGVALQTDVAGTDSPKTGNIRSVSNYVNPLRNMSYGTWRNKSTQIKSW